jgi:polyribonucleotide nucleotidyltransferase
MPHRNPQGHARRAARPRADLSKFAPRIQTIQIDRKRSACSSARRQDDPSHHGNDRRADRHREDDSGKVFIYSNNATRWRARLPRSTALRRSAVAAVAAIEVGKLYHGRVTGIKDFGCFVECTPGKEGLCHISELADFRVRRTEDVVKIG